MKKETNLCSITRAVDAESNGDVEELSLELFSWRIRVEIDVDFVSVLWPWRISRSPREACSCCLPDFEGPKAACLPAGCVVAHGVPMLDF